MSSTTRYRTFAVHMKIKPLTVHAYTGQQTPTSPLKASQDPAATNTNTTERFPPAATRRRYAKRAFMVPSLTSGFPPEVSLTSFLIWILIWISTRGEPQCLQLNGVQSQGSTVRELNHVTKDSFRLSAEVPKHWVQTLGWVTGNLSGNSSISSTWRFHPQYTFRPHEGACTVLSVYRSIQWKCAKRLLFFLIYKIFNMKQKQRLLKLSLLI